MNHNARIPAIHYAKSHKSRFIDQMGEWLAIPSVSTDPENQPDILQAANWIADYLKKLGCKHIQFLPPEEGPVVYADHLEAGPDAPTILIYGHYDVQPAEPLEKWKSDPFRPTVHGENLYARGASDMKGQVLATTFAIESILNSGRLPVNVKFLLEGEEEIGSPHLGNTITDNKELLDCDFCLNPDAGMLAADLPTITYGLRGLAYFEIRVFGPKQDLHSGSYGGVVHNPAQALCELIAGMHDEDGKVTLPGFYDQVRHLDQEERDDLSRLPRDEGFFLEQTGVQELWGERGYTPIERIGVRPTLEVNGLYSGYIDEGQKTVLPAYALAKISTRLVPDQDSSIIKDQLKTYLETNAPSTIRWELEELSQSPASLSDRNSFWIQSMTKAMETVWGNRPLFRRDGASVPVVVYLREILGLESVNVGCTLPDDNVHGPNEKLHLPTWEKNIDALIHFFYNLAD